MALAARSLDRAQPKLSRRKRTSASNSGNGGQYIIPYSKDARKRHYHRTERGRVVNFVVQIEVEVEGEWTPVVRYDCSHKFVHRDSYDLKSRQRKEEIDLNDEEALTFADEGLDENWERYHLTFLAGGHR